MGRLRYQRDEIPKGVMGRSAGRDLVVRLWLYGVDEIREFDRILDEKHRHVVAHQVEVAFLSKELHRKAAHIAHGIARAAWPLDGGKAYEYRGDFLRVLQEPRLGQRCMGLVGLEVAMGTGTPGMDDALRNTLVVKVRDLLTHDEVFQQRWPTVPGLQGVLVVGDLDALVGAQGLAGGVATKAFQALQLGIGVGPVRGLGAGGFTVLRRVRVLAGHGRLSSSVFRRARSGLFT
ncbi:hypothetical protein D3C80_1424640 [compost metagenome]